jgi:hypothetical protein
MFEAVPVKTVVRSPIRMDPLRTAPKGALSHFAGTTRRLTFSTCVNVSQPGVGHGLTSASRTRTIPSRSFEISYTQ